jgi:uncharacterized protein YbjT (DUF2867 family)
MENKSILVTGATGYVGGRLVPRLLEQGHRVRAMGRSLQKLQSRPWAQHPNIELVAGDVMNPEDVARCLTGIEVMYYLVHSMNAGNRDFAEADRKAARLIAEHAAQQGLERIIYLGGLGEEGSEDLSHHLRSRTEVADILRHGTVPVTVLRAAMIIGSGSASFEILRYLVEHLPVMVTPRWVDTPSQPIGIANVLAYLIGCLQVPETTGQTFDIGGPTVLTYRQLMALYAEAAGLSPRVIVPVPVFTPKLSSYWIHLVTPVPAVIARPLAEGLKNPVVCRENRIQQLIPQRLLTPEEAIQRAMQRVQQQQVETHWTDAGQIPPAEWRYPGDPGWTGGTVYEDTRRIQLKGSPQAVWEPIVRIGGETGWYYGNWLWALRGILDRLVGGVGLYRGRRHGSQLMPGDCLDFWRVVRVDPPHDLALVAEMKLPGKAVLAFQLKEVTPGVTELTQTARFLPGGLPGLLYWWAVTPFHYWVFNGMLKGIAKASRLPVV